MKISGHYPETDWSSPRPAPIFPRFPDLPVEIRDQIWETAVHDVNPRIVTPQRKVKGCTVPALLHVSREARGHALKRYNLREIPYYYGFLTRRMNTYVWVVDYDEDFVFFNYSSPMLIPDPSSIVMNRKTWKRNIRHISSETAKKVKKVAIGVQWSRGHVNMENRMYWPLFWTSLLEACPKISEMNLILRPLKNGDIADIVDMDNDGKDLTWRERGVRSWLFTGSDRLRFCLEHHFELLYPDFSDFQDVARKYSRFKLRRYWWDDILFRYADTAAGVMYHIRYAAVVAMLTGLFARSWIIPFTTVVLFSFFECIRCWILDH
jgi:hypothetical protein